MESKTSRVSLLFHRIIGPWMIHIYSLECCIYTPPLTQVSSRQDDGADKFSPSTSVSTLPCSLSDFGAKTCSILSGKEDVAAILSNPNLSSYWKRATSRVSELFSFPLVHTYIPDPTDPSLLSYRIWMIRLVIKSLAIGVQALVQVITKITWVGQ